MPLSCLPAVLLASPRTAIAYPGRASDLGQRSPVALAHHKGAEGALGTGCSKASVRFGELVAGESRTRLSRILGRINDIWGLRETLDKWPR